MLVTHGTPITEANKKRSESQHETAIGHGGIFTSPRWDDILKLSDELTESFRKWDEQVGQKKVLCFTLSCDDDVLQEWVWTSLVRRLPLQYAQLPTLHTSCTEAWNTFKRLAQRTEPAENHVVHPDLFRQIGPSCRDTIIGFLEDRGYTVKLYFDKNIILVQFTYLIP